MSKDTKKHKCKKMANTNMTTTTITITHLNLSKPNNNRFSHQQPITNYPPNFPFPKFKPSFSLPSSSSFTLNCKSDNFDTDSFSDASSVLGVEPGCSSAQLKAAFRARVKQFHPDVRKNAHESDFMICRVIQAYEARCPYSCVKNAPYAFTFSSSGTARATSQGHGEDYQVQLAVGRCPRSCIHYVTPSQRIILEELFDSIIDTPYDTSAEEELLYGLIVKAKYENNRYQKPKKQSKVSSEPVDWF